MTVAAGEMLARVNSFEQCLAGRGTKSEAGSVIGQAAEARLSAFPGGCAQGRRKCDSSGKPVPDSRTLRVRVELPNPDGRLRPGLTAQVNQPFRRAKCFVGAEARPSFVPVDVRW